MAVMPSEVYEAVKREDVLKCMATVDSSGIPNAVVVATVSAMDEETIIFANLKLGKTRENLLNTKKFTVNILTPEMESYQLKCKFLEFQEKGPLAEQVNEKVYSKIKMQISEVGIGKVEEIYSACLSKPGVKIA